MSSTRQPPHGRITILFTDIEDSSRMNTALGDSVYRETMRDPHCQRLRAAVEAHDGFEVNTVGDSFMVVFDRADDAIACAAAMQRSLAEPPITATDKDGESWTVRVLIVHTDERELRPQPEGDSGGIDYQFASPFTLRSTNGDIWFSEEFS